MYVVGVDALTIGLAIVGSLNPTAGDQLYSNTPHAGPQHPAEIVTSSIAHSSQLVHALNWICANLN